MTKVVFLSERERARLLYWLHKPVPPSREKELDEQLIRKLS